MSFLFTIEGNKVYPKATTLLIEPFKSIWERDRSKDKDKAIKDFGYIEFMTSKLKSNPFRGYNEVMRDKEIRKSLKLSQKWQKDELIEEGFKFISKMQKEGSKACTFLQTAESSIENLDKFLRRVDYKERNKSGMPVWKPRDVTSALKDTRSLLQELKALEKLVDEELIESIKNRGGKEVSDFANPEYLNLK